MRAQIAVMLGPCRARGRVRAEPPSFLLRHQPLHPLSVRLRVCLLSEALITQMHSCIVFLQLQKIFMAQDAAVRDDSISVS